MPDKRGVEGAAAEVVDQDELACFRLLADHGSEDGRYRLASNSTVRSPVASAAAIMMARRWSARP